MWILDIFRNSTNSQFVGLTSAGNMQVADIPSGEDSQSNIDIREDTASAAMNLLRMPNIPNTPITKIDIVTAQTLTNLVLDSRYQLSFEEFSSNRFKEQFYQLFLDMLVNNENSSGRVVELMEKTKTMILQDPPKKGFWYRFKRQNLELYADINIASQKNTTELDNSMDQDLHEAYTIMLSYPEVTNRKLFE